MTNCVVCQRLVHESMAMCPRCHRATQQENERCEALAWAVAQRYCKVGDNDHAIGASRLAVVIRRTRLARKAEADESGGG